MNTKNIDLSACKSVFVMALNPDQTITVAASGTADQLVELVCGSVDIVTKEQLEDFPLILIAGIEMWCLNNAITFEDLLRKMRENIALVVPNNKK